MWLYVRQLEDNLARSLADLDCGRQHRQTRFTKKLCVAPESRSNRKGLRTPTTCKLTITRRELPRVAVAFYRARSTDNWKVGLPPGAWTSLPTSRAPFTYWSRAFFGRVTTPLLIILTTCADIGAGARHSAVRHPGFLPRKQIICRPVRASLLWGVSRRRPPDDSLISISMCQKAERR